MNIGLKILEIMIIIMVILMRIVVVIVMKMIVVIIFMIVVMGVVIVWRVVIVIPHMSVRMHGWNLGGISIIFLRVSLISIWLN